MNRYKLTYNRIFSKRQLTSKYLHTLFLSNKYDENLGWGFSNISLCGTLVSGSYLHKTKRYYQVWDAENNRLDKISYFIVKEIVFFLNIEKSCVIVLGGTTDLNGLKAAFRHLLWGEFTYADFDSNVYAFVSDLYQSQMLMEIEEVSFSDVVIHNHFLGKYIAKPTTLINNIDSVKLIHGNLDKAKVRISMFENDFELSVSSNNTFTINGTEDSVQSFVEYLISKN